MAISSLAIGSGLLTWVQDTCEKALRFGRLFHEGRVPGAEGTCGPQIAGQSRDIAPRTTVARCKQTVCRGFVVTGSVTGWLGTGVSLALAASLRFVVAMPSDRAIQQESIPGHVRSLLATHLTDLTTSEEHTVKPWFNGKLDVSPLVIDLAPQGFPPIAVGSIIFTTASSAL